MVNLVEICVENYRKSTRKTIVKLCKTFIQNKFFVYKIIYQLTFPTFPTTFFTNDKPLLLNYFFHYSTPPTTMTTKYINIVKKGNLNEN